jgi:hypothetical protein
MRKSTRGILAMNIFLSISHDTATGITCAILLGCSSAQQAFVCEQLKELSNLAVHPLLLPILFSGYQQFQIGRETELLWRDLVNVETKSGRTGAPVVRSDVHSMLNRENGDITNAVLGIVQLASYWESHTKGGVLGIESIQKSIEEINKKTPDPRKSKMEEISRILNESLTVSSHNSSVMLWDLEFINKRATAQMTAVSSTTSLDLSIVSIPVV